MSDTFWQDKRVLVTGHTGFKGGWLALWLGRLGARVTGLALPPDTQPNLFEGAHVADAIQSYFVDLRKVEEVVATVERAEPQIVFHLAAQSLVRYGYRHPLETYGTNVLGTAHLLEAIRRQPGVRVVVSVTSDKCYRNFEHSRGYRETDELGGKDPYSNSKACAELVTAAYRDSFLSSPAGGSVAVATARAGNVIGGGDWAQDRLLPDLVRGFAAGRPVPIRCPDATRPWQHVLEPLAGYLRLAHRLWQGGDQYAEPWNFGPAEEDHRTVAWVADRMAELWGSGARWELDEEVHPPEAGILKLDCSKAHQRLDWRPRLGLARALEWVVEWYRAEAGGADLAQLTLDQIERYEKLPAQP